MATKPTTAATWDSNGTNMSAPTGAHKTDGFANSEIPTSAEVNGQLNLVGTWTEWLFDGMPDNVVTNYALADGNNNDIDLTGAASLEDKTYFQVTHNIAASQAVITGIANGYNGKEIVITTMEGADCYFIAYESASSSANNRIYGPAIEGIASTKRIVVPPSGSLRLRYMTGLTPPGGGTGRWFIVSAANCYTEEVLHMPISGIFSDPSGVAYGQGTGSGGPPGDDNNRRIRQGIMHAGNVQTDVTVGLPLDLGTYIIGYDLRVNKTSGTGTTIDTNLANWDAATGTLTDETPATLATNNPGYTTIPFTLASPIVVAEDKFYQVRIRTHDGAVSTPTGGGTDYSYGIKLKVWRPLL